MQKLGLERRPNFDDDLAVDLCGGPLTRWTEKQLEAAQKDFMAYLDTLDHPLDPVDKSLLRQALTECRVHGGVYFPAPGDYPASHGPCGCIIGTIMLGHRALERGVQISQLEAADLDYLEDEEHVERYGREDSPMEVFARAIRPSPVNPEKESDNSRERRTLLLAWMDEYDRLTGAAPAPAPA